MLKLTTQQREQFAAAVKIAIASSATSGIDAIYSRFEQERVARAPKCDQSGRCCRFESYGHRLFVSTLEVARFWQQVSPDRHFAGDSRSMGKTWDGTGCPFQFDGLCSVHPARPFGCRAYFCDPTSTRWQQEQYERFHNEIRELHTGWAVPYLYVEWREALASLGIFAAGVGQNPRSLPILGQP